MNVRLNTKGPSEGRAVRFPVCILQRKCACGQHTAGGQCDDCKKKHETLQRYPARVSAVNTVPPIVHDVLRSPGQPLDAETRAFMEPRFGQDFSRVRVHSDTKAGLSAQAVNALAYTVGNDIVFATGRYSPLSPDGRHLLAHELTHALQQSHGMQQMQRAAAEAIEEDNEQLENEAEETASDVMAAEPEEIVSGDYGPEGELVASRDASKKTSGKPKGKSRAKPKPKPNPCKRTVLSEGSCADLVQKSKYRCCDPANGLENKARDKDIEGKSCPSHKFTPQFTCEKHCTGALTKGCNDSDHWMAIPGKRKDVMAQCGQTYTICANGKRATGHVRDRSVTRTRYEVSPGILQALGLPLQSSFPGAVYKSGTSQSVIDKDACCATPTPPPSPSPMPPVPSPRKEGLPQEGETQA